MTDKRDKLHGIITSPETVTPLPRRISRNGSAILSRIVNARHLQPVIDRPYLIKGWIDKGAVSVVYGAPNVGKSFWAIDVAHHVQEGTSWVGRRVKQGNVLYIAAEGGAMFTNRLCARQASFHVLQASLNLGTPSGDAAALVEAVNALAEQIGGIDLIVIDTLSRVMVGADENSAADMGRFVATIERIREGTGAHVMLVHHCGKDVAKGMRGSSVLLAAIDTEIELKREDEALNTRTAKTTKQRDMAGGLEDEFHLNVEALGTDSDGDQVTSCTVRHIRNHTNMEDFA